MWTTWQIRQIVCFIPSLLFIIFDSLLHSVTPVHHLWLFIPFCPSSLIVHSNLSNLSITFDCPFNSVTPVPHLLLSIPFSHIYPSSLTVSSILSHLSILSVIFDYSFHPSLLYIICGCLSHSVMSVYCQLSLTVHSLLSHLSLIFYYLFHSDTSVHHHCPFYFVNSIHHLWPFILFCHLCPLSLTIYYILSPLSIIFNCPFRSITLVHYLWLFHSFTPVNKFHFISLCITFYHIIWL